MSNTPGFYEINFIPVFPEQRPKLGPCAYSIANRHTLVSGALDETASENDFIGAPEHCESIVLYEHNIVLFD